MNKLSLVIEFNEKEIRIAELKVASFLGLGKTLNSVGYDCTPIPEGVIEQGVIEKEEVLIESLKKLKTIYNVSSIYLSIPVQHGVIRHFSLPWISKRERSEAVGYLVEEEIPLPKHDLLYDYMTIKEDRKSNFLRIMVGAGRKSHIEPYVNCLTKAGFEVIQAGIAVINLWHFLGIDSEEDVIYLESDGSNLKFILFKNSMPELIRNFTEDFSELSFSEENLSREIKRTILYFENQNTELTVKRIVTQGSHLSFRVAERLVRSGVAKSVEKAQLNFPSKKNKTNSEINASNLNVASYAFNIGKGNPVINLWGSDRSEKFIGKIQTGFLILSLIIFSGFAYQWFSLHEYEGKLEDDVNILAKQGSGDLREKKIKKDIEERWEELLQHPTQVGINLSKVKSIPVFGLELQEIKYGQGEIRLEGNADRGDEVVQFIEKLKKLGWVNPSISKYRQDDQKPIVFSVTLKESD